MNVIKAVCIFAMETLLIAALVHGQTPPVAAVKAQEKSVRLLEAAKRGDTTAVRSLLAAGASLGATEPDGMTALHWAARRGDEESAQMLLKAKANVRATTRYGITPLWEASRAGSVGIIRHLIEAGADPNSPLPSGETALMVAGLTGNVRAINLLADYGADINAREEWQGETALMYAVNENHVEAVQALIGLGADVNALARRNTIPRRYALGAKTTNDLFDGAMSPLMLASRQGYVDVGQKLLEAGANVNYVEPGGISVMLLAVMNGHYDFAAMLVKHGANPNDGSLYEAIDMHNYEAISVIGMRPPPKAEDSIDAIELARLLLEHGADPNGQRGVPLPARTAGFNDIRTISGLSSLQRAAQSLDLEAIRLLLEFHADPNLIVKPAEPPRLVNVDLSKTGVIARTAVAPRLGGPHPLAMALQPNRRPSAMLFRPNPTREDVVPALALLVEYGANVNQVDQEGNTALHVAAQAGADPAVRFLVEHGANLSTKNKDGLTPLEVAMALTPVRGGGGEFAPPAPKVQESTVKLLRELAAAQQPQATQ